MPVTFVIGRAGSGKTHRTFDRICQSIKAEPLGRPIFLIVPKQATFTAERELLARSGGFSRVRILSFDLLGRQIAADCGRARVPEVTSLGRQMILAHLLIREREKLIYFKASATRPGLAAELGATFEEFEQSGRAPGDLSDILEWLRGADPADEQGPSLQAKLRDLAHLYVTYTAYIGQDRLDPFRRMNEMLDHVKRCKLVNSATFHIDDFNGFTRHERQFLAGLAARCEEMEINLTIDPSSPTIADPHHLPDEFSVFHRTEETYRRLFFAMGEAGVRVAPPVRLSAPRRFQAAALARVEDRFAPAAMGAQETARTEAPRTDASRTGNPGDSIGVLFLEAPNLAAEVDGVAREIQAHLRAGGRLRDAVVLARNVNDYEGLIDRSFREHGIPYFLDRRRPAAHHPLVQFVRSAFEISRHDWRRPAVMCLLRSGLAGVELLEADAIENYLMQHGVGGTAWEASDDWRYQRELAADGPETAGPEKFDTASIDALRRRVASHLQPLQEIARAAAPRTVKAIAAALFETLERFEVRRRLAEWVNHASDSPDPNLVEAAEHQQVWTELVSLFDQMVELLGEEPVALDDFINILDAGLDRFDLALAPPTLDQVLVGQIDRTRTSEPQIAFVMGLIEGKFPQPPGSISLLSRTDRRALHSRELEMEADANRLLLDETFLAYLAFTRASARLVLSRPRADAKGRATERSKFWRRLQELVPGAPVCAVERESTGGRDIQCIATPTQLVTSLMRWAREAEPGPAAAVIDNSPGAAPLNAADDLRAALYDWLAHASAAAEPSEFSRLVNAAWPALTYENRAELSAEVAAALFSSPLQATARQLETFAACPFQHFARYGLRLSPREEHRITGLDLSQVYHRLIEVIAAEIAKAGNDWKDLNPADAARLIRHYGTTVASQLKSEVMLSSARGKYILGRIERTLEMVTRTLQIMQSRGDFRTLKTELSFGRGRKLAPTRPLLPPALRFISAAGSIGSTSIGRMVARACRRSA